MDFPFWCLHFICAFFQCQRHFQNPLVYGLLNKSFRTNYLKLLHCTCCRSQAVLVPLAMRERAAVMGTEPRPLHVVQSNANLICYWSLQSRTCSYMSHILSLRGNLAWDFWGISFWSKVFLEGFVARMRGFDFCPHLIIRSTIGYKTTLYGTFVAAQQQNKLLYNFQFVLMLVCFSA